MKQEGARVPERRGGEKGGNADATHVALHRARIERGSGKRDTDRARVGMYAVTTVGTPEDWLLTLPVAVDD